MVLTLACSSVLLAFFSLASCQRAAEKQQEKIAEKAIEQGSGGKADVDIDKDKITIETGEGKIEINNTANVWPSEVPSDVPELNVGKIVGTTTTNAEEGKNWSIRYEGVPLEELEKYAATLKGNGFKIQTIKSGKGGMVNGEKGAISVVFTVSKEVSVLMVSQAQKTKGDENQ